MMSTENRPVNKGRYADTRILIKEMNELIADIQAIAPEISIAQLQMNSDLPSNELYNLRGGNISNVNRIREAIRFLKNTKNFLDKAETKPVEVVNKEPKNNKIDSDEYIEKIIRIKKENKMADSEIAKILKVSTVAVGTWKRGERYPSKDNQNKINQLMRDLEIGEKEEMATPTEETTTETTETTKKYSFIERIKILFKGEI